MKIEIADVSGLPDALKSLVSTEGETTTLDLAAVAPATELEAFKAKALTAQNEAIDRRKALDKWKALGETPEAIQEKINAKAKGDPNHERIVEEMKATHAAELAERDEKLTGVYKRTAAAELKASLAEVGFIPDALDMVATTAMSRLKYGDDGTPQIMAADGSTPMVGGAANGGATMADLAKQLAEANPFAVKDNGKGGGGKPPNGQGGKPGQKTVKRSEFDAMSHPDRAAFSKDGGKVVD